MACLIDIVHMIIQKQDKGIEKSAGLGLSKFVQWIYPSH